MKNILRGSDRKTGRCPAMRRKHSLVLILLVSLLICKVFTLEDRVYEVVSSKPIVLGDGYLTFLVGLARSDGANSPGSFAHVMKTNPSIDISLNLFFAIESPDFSSNPPLIGRLAEANTNFVKPAFYNEYHKIILPYSTATNSNMQSTMTVSRSASEISLAQLATTDPSGVTVNYRKTFASETDAPRSMQFRGNNQYEFYTFSINRETLEAQLILSPGQKLDPIDNSIPSKYMTLYFSRSGLIIKDINNDNSFLGPSNMLTIPNFQPNFVVSHRNPSCTDDECYVIYLKNDLSLKPIFMACDRVPHG